MGGGASALETRIENANKTRVLSLQELGLTKVRCHHQTIMFLTLLGSIRAQESGALASDALLGNQQAH